MSLVNSESNRFLQFMEMAVDNPAILHRLNELPDDDMAGLLKIASDAGFRLSIEEVNMVVKEVQATMLPGDELSDDDLDAVAGGTNDFNRLNQLQQALSNVIKKMNQQSLDTIRKIS
jgi:hypothetical protein